MQKNKFFCLAVFYILTWREFSKVKMYCDVTLEFIILNNPKSHVTPNRGNNTMQAFTVVLG